MKQPQFSIFDPEPTTPRAVRYGFAETRPVVKRPASVPYEPPVVNREPDPAAYAEMIAFAKRTKTPVPMQSMCIWSDDQRYRYSLSRKWGKPGTPDLMIIGLNPSTADENHNDPTISRCIGYAFRWGYGGLHMLNLFAFRSTDPRRMPTAIEAKGGPDCDRQLIKHADASHLIIAAWGSDKLIGDRGRIVCELLARPIHCLGVNKDGNPKHPLYLKSDLTPQLYWSPEAAS